MADGGLPVTFKVVTPLAGQLDDRMAQNDARSLQEAAPHKTCVVVGSGPSARHPALWERLWLEPDTTTVACNGALSLFTERGLRPTYWSCCDPQDEVLNFLPTYPPHETIYLLATKCPPALFDALSGRIVRKWRLDDIISSPGKLHITCAVSITLVTMNLMRMKGFTRFETYGWDCCYLDGQHHASNQPTPEGIVPFELRDAETDELMQAFEVCPAWAAELNDACIQAHNYKAMGYELIVHGPGAVGALLRAKGLIA